MSAIVGPSHSWESPSGASADLLWVDKADETVCHYILGDSTHFSDCHSICGHAHVELVSNGTEAVRSGKLPDGNSNMLIWSQGWG